MRSYPHSREEKRSVRKAIVRAVGPAAVALTLLVAQGQGSAAPKLTHAECNIDYKVCIKGCGGLGGRLERSCTADCDLRVVRCHQQAPAKEAGKPNKDAKPKKAIDPARPPGKWVPPKATGGMPLPAGNTGKWVPNARAKGIGTSVPAAGTWNPSPSSGGKAQSLKSGGRR